MFSPSSFHIGKASPGFVSNARRMLQVKSATHYSQGMKSGKLSSSRLYRAGMPAVGDGSWNSKVFKRKTKEADILNSCIQIVVDCSGSMRGNKIKHAGQAAGLLNDAFSNVLRIPCEILGFTHGCGKPEMVIIKSFAKRASNDDIANRFYRVTTQVGLKGNDDADALLFAYRRILQRKEKRKVMCVLSDGQPADGNGDPYWGLKQVAGSIESEGLCDLYGIGIMDTNVSHFYKNWRVIDRAEAIEPTLIDVMAKALT